MTPAGYLPVALFAFGVIGMLWADVGLHERWKGLESFIKLLMIPLLLTQYRSGGRARCVFVAYLAACLLVFALSSMFYFWPNTAFLFTKEPYVPLKNAATQSGEFVTCIFGLLYLAIEAFERRRWLWMAGLIALALGLLANILYVAIGRTVLIVIPVLLALLALKKLSRKGILVVFVGVVMIGSIGWFSSSNLRDRTTQLWTDVEKYQASDNRNSSGERIEFYKKSVGFILEAPLFGHGTGSITSLFGRTGKDGVMSSSGIITSNPHNQTFAVAIQLGIAGAIVLWAMWIAHLLLFRGPGLVAWIGLVVVVQNILGSLFNSHLFDFGQGWVYVVGVGVAGGAVLKERAARSAAAPS
jgi:hypothetical protein